MAQMNFQTRKILFQLLSTTKLLENISHMPILSRMILLWTIHKWASGAQPVLVLPWLHLHSMMRYGACQVLDQINCLIVFIFCSGNKLALGVWWSIFGILRKRSLFYWCLSTNTSGWLANLHIHAICNLRLNSQSKVLSRGKETCSSSSCCICQHFSFVTVLHIQ